MQAVLHVAESVKGEGLIQLNQKPKPCIRYAMEGRWESKITGEIDAFKQVVVRFIQPMLVVLAPSGRLQSRPSFEARRGHKAVFLRFLQQSRPRIGGKDVHREPGIVISLVKRHRKLHSLPNAVYGFAWKTDDQVVFDRKPPPDKLFVRLENILDGDALFDVLQDLVDG